jgi:hypothetical protein
MIECQVTESQLHKKMLNPFQLKIQNQADIRDCNHWDLLSWESVSCDLVARD